MEIEKYWFRELPEKLTGYVVVVDAWAASANMAVLLSKKPRNLIVVNENNLPQAKKAFPEAILIGESDILPLNAFLWSNELADMIDGDVTGKDVLWMSVNGSRIFEETIMKTEVKEVLAGSLQNYSAVVDHLLNQNGKINIIMAGNRKKDVEEDRICAQMLEGKLLGKKIDLEEVTRGVAAAIRAYGYPEMAEHNIPYLLRTIDQFRIVPRCFQNPQGFLEIKDASI